MSEFIFEKHDKTPLYLQIANWIDKDIENQTYPAGYRLVTERELCEQLGVARGTVKNAYMELERRGKIQKIQGRGTFVTGGDMQSELEHAHRCANNVILKLRGFGVSYQEIEEILRQEAWGHLKRKERIHIAWVDCSPELLDTAVRQITRMCNVEVTPYLLDRVVEKPEVLKQSYDLIATSFMHHDILSKAITPRGLSSEKVVLLVDNVTINKLAAIEDSTAVAVLYESESYLSLVENNLLEYGLLPQFTRFSIQDDLDQFCSEQHKFKTIVIPPNIMDSCYTKLHKAAEYWAKKGAKLVPFEFLLDQGSLIHLKQLAQQCWTKQLEETNK